MKLSISVMAHPSREKYFGYLKKQLGNSPISIDTGFGIWENCKRAWRMHNPDADWHVVIQDDALVCENFRSMAEKIIDSNRHHKNIMFNFYFGNRKAFKDIAAQGLKNKHIIMNRLNWGIAICLPVDLIEEMIAFGDRINVPQDDARIQRFLMSRRIMTYFPMPSLIDQRSGEPSLVGDPGRGRKAYYFIDNIK